MHDDETPDPEMDARVAETKRVRALPVGEFVAHLQGLIAGHRQGAATFHLYDQLFEHLDEHNRNMPRLKEIVTLILERIHSPSFIHSLNFFLKTPARHAEPQELIELITTWGNKQMRDAMVGPAQVPVTDPQTGLTAIHPTGSEAALLRPLR